jgi:hypothetical protein
MWASETKWDIRGAVGTQKEDWGVAGTKRIIGEK